MKFYTSDLHIFHDNIIELSHRPFKNMEEMIETIINKWNNKVTENDEVYIIGDFFWGKNRQATYDILDRLNGKKYLIVGNHDRLGYDKKFSSYFKRINYFTIIDDNDRRVVLFHYPMEEWPSYFYGAYHLYGHVHNNTAHELLKMSRRYNVCADVNDFEPMTLDELIKRNEQ